MSIHWRIVDFRKSLDANSAAAEITEAMSLAEAVLIAAGVAFVAVAYLFAYALCRKASDTDDFHGEGE